MDESRDTEFITFKRRINGITFHAMVGWNRYAATNRGLRYRQDGPFKIETNVGGGLILGTGPARRLSVPPKERLARRDSAPESVAKGR